MAPTRNNDGLLARVNFPLYTLQMVTSRHILVGGGGGSSKTGVANGFEIFEISHNGETFVAEEAVRHETGPTVVMNSATYNDGKRTFLVAGQESHCQLYHVRLSVENEKRNSISSADQKEAQSNDNQTRQRKKRNSTSETSDKTSSNKSEKQKDKVTSNGVNKVQKRLHFEIKPSDSIQTDFSKEEPLQKVVRISRNGEIMVTGGTDGFIRVWQFPTMNKLLNIKAHTKEIDDLDICPDSATIASISKDGACCLWNSKTGKKTSTLTWEIPANSKYLYKRCRFGIRGNGTDFDSLFTLANPVGRAGNLKSYLQMWEPASGKLRRNHAFDESLAALAVRDDGMFVAVGTMFSGSVSIHVAFSLQRIMNVRNAHGMFVTGLEFLPTSLDGPAITCPYEAAVVSISVDNRVCIHQVPFRQTMPVWLVLVLMVILLCASFTVCSYFGL
ncbi:prolactin regulatory element-binding protein [Frankliniella occidentalis]|uniref:Prolactin regulatory element-binding protein n=1 Tax=Frankliniella occidentalis TaxID=133901 RepID=A0A6J1TBE8_FRAOC|nr:prolactin regulatory element-binding protein [Frankliniella occidentalis]